MLEKKKQELNLPELFRKCTQERRLGSYKYFTEISLKTEEYKSFRKWFSACEMIGLEFCFAVLEWCEEEVLIYGYSNFEIIGTNQYDTFDMLRNKETVAECEEIDLIFKDMVEICDCLLIAEPFKHLSKNKK